MRGKPIAPFLPAASSIGPKRQHENVTSFDISAAFFEARGNNASLAQLHFHSDKRPISFCRSAARVLHWFAFSLYASLSIANGFNPRVVEIESLTSDVAAREKVVA